MTLKDKIDNETRGQGINEKNIEPIVTKFSFIDAAEAYINAHPNEPYGQILNSGESEEMIRIQMKSFVYGKILDQLIIEHEARVPNSEKYERWVEEQQEYIDNEAYCYGLTPEEMNEQYTSWMHGMGRYKLEVRELIREMKENKEYQSKD
jgi:hypothetical protein